METYSFYKCLFGILQIYYKNNSVIRIELAEKNQLSVPKSKLSEHVHMELDEYFSGNRKKFDFPISFDKVTEFQKSVWQSLLKIPYGKTASYKEIAIAIGKPKACRAVGLANNKNPIMIVVPCHRVIGSNGKLVGYACGLEMKARLLKFENTGKWK